MSIYHPDPKTLNPAAGIGGYWLMDQFGPLDGPYESLRDVLAVINQHEAEEEEAASRFAGRG